jgi:hypothetical protein
VTAHHAVTGSIADAGERPLTNDELLEFAVDVLVVAALGRSSRRPSPTTSGPGRGKGANHRSRPVDEILYGRGWSSSRTSSPNADSVTMPYFVGAEQPGHPLGDRGLSTSSSSTASRAPTSRAAGVQDGRAGEAEAEAARQLSLRPAPFSFVVERVAHAAALRAASEEVRVRHRAPRWVDLEHLRRICEIGVTSRMPRPSLW